MQFTSLLASVSDYEVKENFEFGSVWYAAKLDLEKR